MFEFSAQLIFKGIISLGDLIGDVKKLDTYFDEIIKYIVLKYNYLNTIY